MTLRDQLPAPDSEELRRTLGAAELRRIYRILCDSRANPPTMSEIEEQLREITRRSRSQRGRRVRDLYPHFQIDKTPDTAAPRYLLVAPKVAAKDDSAPISKRLRAQVLQPQRCAMCGRTPLEDRVRLVVDHKLPRDWGGSNDPHNLQPVCEDCNLGKENHFRTFAEHSAEIKQAADYPEPQKRIGELFLAFEKGYWIKSDLFEAVANAREPQEDWQRRMRDLRFLGWNYTFRTAKEGGRVKSYYKLTKSAPWPGNIRQALKEEETRRRQAKKLAREA